MRCATCDGFACKLGAKNDAEVRLVGPALATGRGWFFVTAGKHEAARDG